MTEIATRIEIEASPERVWMVLSDFSAMASWTPFLCSIEGELREGKTIKVRIAPVGGPTLTFKPILRAVKPAKELRWLGVLFAPAFFCGEHSFFLEEVSDGKTILTHREKFSGLLASLLMSGSTLQTTRDGFIAMNEALKRRAEERLC